MIKVGDRVKFLNDVGGGIVTGFIGKNMANVENEDGFEVPYPVSMLINVDDPDLNRSNVVPEKTVARPAQQPAPSAKPEGMILAGKDSADFYFCIVPYDSKNPVGGDVDLYLVNDSNFTVLYRYAHYKNEMYKTIKSGQLLPNSKVELETIGRDELVDLPDYSFQLVYFKKEEKELFPAIVKKFKVSPVKFYKEKSFSANRFFRKNAMMFKITENIMETEIDRLTRDDLKKVVKAKEKTEPEPQITKSRQPDIVEVDLHIHELIDDSAGLSNKEILELQLEKVEHEMHAAIQGKAKRLVFIHGVGQGVLKQEVSKLLKSKFSKYSFQDASFKEYGYGATMVILRR